MSCRQREQQTANLRKTAEKLLLAQLKRHALQNMSTQPSDAQLAHHLKEHPEAVEATVQRLAHEGASATGTAGACTCMHVIIHPFCPWMVCQHRVGFQVPGAAVYEP